MNEATRHPGQPDRLMTAADLASWGVQDVAYIKAALNDGGPVWSIHSADGTQLGIAPDRDVAFAAVRQHDLEPLSVH